MATSYNLFCTDVREAWLKKAATDLEETPQEVMYRLITLLSENYDLINTLKTLTRDPAKVPEVD